MIELANKLHENKSSLVFPHALQTMLNSDNLMVPEQAANINWMTNSNNQHTIEKTSSSSTSYASSPNDSAYASGSERFSQSPSYSHSTSSQDSQSSLFDFEPSNLESNFNGLKLTETIRPKTILHFESQLTQRKGRKGRPVTSAAIYDEQIDEARKENNIKMLKIARNKKSSQKYRMSKKEANMAIEMDLKLEMTINAELSKKLQKLERNVKDMLKLLQTWNMLN
jgi:hypothetical protein